MERPLTVPNLLARTAYTVAGLMLLYVLSYGPAHYFIWQFPGSARLIREVYNPLTRAIEATPGVSASEGLRGLVGQSR